MVKTAMFFYGEKCFTFGFTCCFALGPHGARDILSGVLTEVFLPVSPSVVTPIDSFIV